MQDIFKKTENKGLKEIIESKVFDSDKEPRFKVNRTILLHRPKSVFEVFDNRTGRERALKLCEYDEDDVCILDNEFETWRKIRAKSTDSEMENIIEICEKPLKFNEDSWGLLMELADESLQNRIQEWKREEKKTKKKIVGEKEAISIVSKISYGTHQAHLISKTHNDIKPSNILIINGIVKVADFECSTLGKDMSTSTKGTFGYIAPEVYIKGLYSRKSDIFSINVIFYQLLEPKYAEPFKSGLEAKKLMKVDLANEGDFNRYLDEIMKPIKASDRTRAILRSCFNIDPEKRGIITPSRKIETLEDYVNELNGEDAIIIKSNPIDYENFKKEYKAIIDKISSPKFHNATPYNAANLQDIEFVWDGLYNRLKQLEDKVLHQSNEEHKTDVVRKIQTLRDLVDQEARKDSKAIDKYLAKGGGFEKIDSNDKKTIARTLLNIYQTTLCWGPPLATEQNKRAQNRGRERYSYAEMKSGKYKEAINPETLRILEMYAK